MPVPGAKYRGVLPISRRGPGFLGWLACKVFDHIPVKIPRAFLPMDGGYYELATPLPLLGCARCGKTW